LHRLLATRIPDYDFEQHFGGVYYLFLRGIDANADSATNASTDNSDSNFGIFHNRPSHDFITQLDTLFSDGAT